MGKWHEMVFDTKGRHAPISINEPPMDNWIHTVPINAPVRLSTSTITCKMGNCRVLVYNTKVRKKWSQHTRTHRLASGTKTMIPVLPDPRFQQSGGCAE